MRYVLGAVFVMFFIGSLACGILLGGPPSSVYAFRDFIIIVAAGLLFLAAIVLIALVFGAFSKDKKRSAWRVPLLCLSVLLIGFVFGIAILASDMENLTPQHGELNFRLMIFAGMMILFALFAGICLILSFILAKKHNAKLPAAPAFNVNMPAAPSFDPKLPTAPAVPAVNVPNVPPPPDNPL